MSSADDQGDRSEAFVSGRRFEEPACYVCGWENCATRIAERPNIFAINCPRCGQYEAADQDYVLRPVPADQRWLLSAWLRTRFSKTGVRFNYEDREGDLLSMDIRPPPMTEKVNLALLVVADSSEGFGSTVTLDLKRECAKVWARDEKELHAIFLHLAQAEMLGRIESVRIKGEHLQLRVTGPGWERVESLGGLRGLRRRAFVAMSFAQDMTRAFDEGIDPALHDTGYLRPFRVDREHSGEKIDDRILAHIRRASLVVVDLSSHRQSVYFEAGFAMGLAIPIAWTCRMGEEKGAHFDVRQFPFLIWETPGELRELLVSHIEARFPRS